MGASSDEIGASPDATRVWQDAVSASPDATPVSPTDAVPGSPALPAILAMCDRVVGEMGRRSHLFSWLRAPGSGPEEWLAVDAYYPAHRLVVVCREDPSASDYLYAELVPAHGLRLLELTPAELGAGGDTAELPDLASAEQALRGRIAELDLPPRRVPGHELEQDEPVRDGAMARVAASLAQATLPDVFEPQPSAARTAATERAARYVAARKARPEAAAQRNAGAQSSPAAERDSTGPRNAATPASGAPTQRMVATLVPYVSRRPPVAPRAKTAAGHDRLMAAAQGRARRRSEATPEAAVVGLLVGVALAAVLSLELYAGVGGLALSGGHVVLGFGLALDACSRALGTVAARRASELGWAWACVLVGCPAVAAFAVFGRDGPVLTEPAPLAGLVAVLAGLLITVAVVANALGGG
jgi:hypothetical protein